MNQFTIYSLATGQIEKQIVVPEMIGMLAMQYDPTISGCIDGHYSDTEFYVDSGQAVSMGARPSAHHVFNFSSKTWIDPRTLQDHRDAKWEQIKASRNATEFGPFTWDGSIFDGDTKSQNRISGAVQMAGLSPTFSTEWTLADNTVRILNASQVIQVGIALAQHVDTAYAVARTLRNQINTAPTPDEVAVINWPI